MMVNEAIVLAGGRGTRLAAVVKDVPKPMADINGRPFLAHQLDYLIQQGIEKVILSVGYKHDIIKQYFGPRYRDTEIVYVVEESPLGTGGAIVAAMQQTKAPAISIVNGDTFFPINLQSLGQTHHAAAADITIALTTVTDGNRYGSVLLDGQSRVIGFAEKTPSAHSLINGGIYVVRTGCLRSAATPQPFSFEKDFLAIRLRQLVIIGKVYQEYFIDIGIPEDYESAKRYFSPGE